MKLENVKISNFKSLRAFDLPDPQKVNVITGKNGSGKSSILEAIRYVLTGELPEAPVTSGEEHCSVSADFIGSTVQRNYGKKSTVKLNGKTTTQKSITEMMENALGCSLDSVKVATSANMLAAMSAGALSDYLVSSGLIPMDIDFDTIKMVCTITKDAEAELQTMLPYTPIKFGFDKIAEVYDYYYGLRSATKKELEMKKLEATFTETAPTRTVSQIDAEIMKLNTYFAEVEAYNKLAIAYNNAVANRDKVLKTISETEAQIKTMGSVPQPDPQELNFYNQQIKKNRDEMDSLFKTKQTLQVNVDMFNRTLASLGKPICPISEKLVCTTDKTEIQEELKQLISDNTTEIEKAEKRLVDLQQKTETINEKIRDYNARSELYRKYANLHERRTALKSAIPILPEKPKVPVEVPNATAEKQKLMDERAVALKYAIAKKAEKDIDVIKKKLEIYNELVTLLSPKKGIQQEIIRIALEPIVEHCNERAKELKLNFAVGMVADNGVRITCNTNTTLLTDFIPLEAASSGEQAYVLFLVMDALNALHGIGLLMLDDLDKLDATAFEALLNLLSKPGVLDQYDHVFMALVDHSDHLDIINKFNGKLIDKVIAL